MNTTHNLPIVSIFDIQARIDRIRWLREEGFESTAHSLTFDLYEHTLKAIARGQGRNSTLARAALEVLR